MNDKVTEQEIKNVKQYNETLSNVLRERQNLVQRALACEVARSTINKAKRCYVWTRAFTDGDGVYVRVYKTDLLEKLSFNGGHHDLLICNDYKLNLNEDGDLYID